MNPDRRTGERSSLFRRYTFIFTPRKAQRSRARPPLRGTARGRGAGEPVQHMSPILNEADFGPDPWKLTSRRRTPTGQLRNAGFSEESHNLHMLVFASSYDGQGTVAFDASDQHVEVTGNEIYPYLSRVRFQKPMKFSNEDATERRAPSMTSP